MTRWLSKLFKKTAQSTQELAEQKTETSSVSNEIKKYDSKENVAEWVKAQRASGIPLMELWRELMKNVGQTDELELMEAYMMAAQEIEDVVVSRNLNGKEYESDGDESKAIILYEANLKDRFDGSHPYERLRIIYSRHKRYEDVIRICQSYIDYGQHDPKLKTKYEEIIDKLREKSSRD